MEIPTNRASYVANVHWHPEVVKDNLVTQKKAGLLKYISGPLGNTASLTKADLKNHSGKETKAYKVDNVYWNVPSMSVAQAESYLSPILTMTDLKSPLALESTSDLNSSSGGNAMRKKRTLSAEAEVEREERDEETRDRAETRKADAKARLTMSQPVQDYVERLERKVEKYSNESKSSKETIAGMAKELEYMTLMLEATDGVKKGGSTSGLTRFNICSDAWHKANPEQSKELFGFEKFSEMKVYLKCFWPELFTATGCFEPSHDSAAPMTLFEQCLITKMRFHKTRSLNCLKGIWERSNRSIYRYVKKWSPMWGRVGLYLSNLDVPEPFLVASMPEEFSKNGLGKVGGLVDGKVFQTDECRTNSVIKRAMFSDKVGRGGGLMHAWVIPCGLAVFHTALYLGRLTEGALVSLSGENSYSKDLGGGVVLCSGLDKFPKGWLILADRGFAYDAYKYPNINRHLTPAFIRKRDQFDLSELRADLNTCKHRYISETSFARLTKEASLKDVVPYHYLSIMQHVNDWACGAANLCAPFYPPKDY